MSSVHIESLNPRFIKVEYAVRGELAIRAEEYRVRLKKPDHGLPFDKVVSSNIGNPQQKGLDQKPLTFNRQVCLIFDPCLAGSNSCLGRCSDGIARAHRNSKGFVPLRRDRTC